MFEALYLLCSWTKFHIMGFVWKLAFWYLIDQYLIVVSRSVTEKSDEQVDLSGQFLVLRQAAH